VSVKFARPPGTHDLLPSDQPLRTWVTGEFESLCSLYGYRRIDTPVFEYTDLFVRTSGETSDVVQKEMYTFTDRGNRSLTLRPDATAPIVRAYLQHGLARERQPQKLYTVETIYRYGRQQKGRYREHWQLDAEAIGSDDPAVDAELIQLYRALLDRLGVTEFRLELNSIGDSRCRPAYVDDLRAWLSAHEADLDRGTREQARRNPLRALDNIAAKPAETQAVLREAPAIGDSLCGPCREHFTEVQRYLDAYEIGYELTPTLVRGLDYYTRTTWEFVGPHEGAQSTLSGGGRYDGLAEEIGGPKTPGVGFGAGVERLVDAVAEAQAGRPAGEFPSEARLEVFFVTDPDADRRLVVRWLRELRASGVSCDIDYGGRSIRGQLTLASRLGAETVVLVRSDSASLRRPGQEDEEVPHDDLPARLRP
jgi:histidyl-tRNA synthetase